MTATQAIYFLIVQTLAVVLASIGVVTTIVWGRIVARRRATIDILLSDQTNPDLLRARSKLSEHGFEPVFDRSAERPLEILWLVAICNRYELMAAGIKEGIIDERLFKNYWRTALVNDWIRLRHAINARRDEANHQTLYCEFEALAKKWATSTERSQM
jgi:Domain of unknown function (DUF4760)